jgi:hypothetical protein
LPATTVQEPATPCTAIGQEGDAWEDCSVADKDDDTDEEEHMEQPMNQSSSKMKKNEHMDPHPKSMFQTENRGAELNVNIPS